MPTKYWTSQDPEAAYEGNNAAFICPHCKHVFIISAAIHPASGGTQGRDGERPCPACRKSTGHVYVVSSVRVATGSCMVVKPSGADDDGE